MAVQAGPVLHKGEKLFDQIDAAHQDLAARVLILLHLAWVASMTGVNQADVG